MKTNYMPNQLPFLPGNTYADPTITRYHKSQLFGVKDHVQTEKTVNLQENVDPDLLRSMREGVPCTLTGIPARRDAENDAIPRIAPKWLKYDRQQLVFEAFFIEPVVENPNENFRARKCKINYFLDDDSVSIFEPKIENSGIPQGGFLKRHKLPHPNDPTKFYTWRDLNVGFNFNVYHRVFRIVDCDDFTKRFYANEGISLNRPEGYPEDLFSHTRAMINFKQTPPD